MNREYYNSLVYQQQRQQEAEHARLVRQAHAENGNRNGSLAKLGRLMIYAGKQLEQRYGEQSSPRLPLNTQLDL